MHVPVPVAAWPLAVTAAVAGVAVGSYLTVLTGQMLADRGTGGAGAPHPPAPRGPAGWRPAGRRLARGTAPRAAGAVPVTGWLPRIGGWDLPMELGTGAGFALMALRFGLSPVLPAFLLLAALAPALAVTDLRCRRLPDRLTLPAYPAAALLLAAGALVIPGGARHFLSALAGLAAAWLFFALTAFIHPADLGWGDVKLSGVLGLYLGWLGPTAVATGLLGAFVLAAMAGLGLIAAGRATRKSQIPFGPFMLASAIAVIATSGLAGSHFP
jgi:leader peptidase (prepilin peptidase) / N-methyltransferase